MLYKKTTITDTAGLTIARKYPAEVQPVPAPLLNIRFDDLTSWLLAYSKYKEILVLRAVIYAFRRRFFLSQREACKMLGISTNSWNRWELGRISLRSDTRRNLILNGWFKPQHFGMDIAAEQFIKELSSFGGGDSEEK